MPNTRYDLSPEAAWRKGLSLREQRFVENFTISVECGDRWWQANLDSDLAIYRYPHTAKVRRAVCALVAEVAKGKHWAVIAAGREGQE